MLSAQPINAVVLEAEDFSRSVAGTPDEWLVQTESNGYLGSGYVVAGIDDNSPGVPAGDILTSVNAPRLDYPVEIEQSGTYRVWVRGWHTNGQNDSVHVGVDGVPVSTADRIVLGGSPGTWQWSSWTMDSSSPQIHFAEPGLYTLNLWMREDGARVDRIVLTPASSSYSPAQDEPTTDPPIVGDFDGDGSLESILPGAVTVRSNGAEIWSVSTPTGSETWNVYRGASTPGHPGAHHLPGEYVVGDFNGDGRDDILGRYAGESTWNLFQSWDNTDSAYDGRFIVNADSTWASTFDWDHPLVGDYNGDGRDDIAALVATPQGQDLVVARSIGARFEVPSTYGTFSLDDPHLATSVERGDFNGDGRDDLLFVKDTPGALTERTLAVSDGSRFLLMTGASTGSAWSETHVGDFDGDGSHELTGRTSVNADWHVLQYDDQTGFELETDWGGTLRSTTPGWTVSVGDVNRDGRDDLIGKGDNGAWYVGYSQPVDGKLGEFTPGHVATEWLQRHQLPGVNLVDDADGRYQELLDIYESVYNEIELEFYPGLMKGPQATAQTKAGNPWDQAALLVERLEVAGFDADMVYGKVHAEYSELKDWLGVTTDVAARDVIVTAFDVNATAPTLFSVEWKHAWVQVKIPTVGGLADYYVDPSWKFKNRQEGVPVDLTNYATSYQGVAGRDSRGTFDEFGYLADADKNDLPVEWYQDQVMGYLAAAHGDKSLADIAYDGSIIQQRFTTLPGAERNPTGQQLPGGLSVTAEALAIENFEAIIDDVAAGGLRERFAHRTTVSLERDQRTEARTFGVGQSVDLAAPYLTSHFPISSSSVSRWGYSSDNLNGNRSVTNNSNGDLSVEISGTQYAAIRYEGNQSFIVNDASRFIIEFDFESNGDAGVQRIIGLANNSGSLNSTGAIITQIGSDSYTPGSGVQRIRYSLDSNSYLNGRHIVLGLQQATGTVPLATYARYSNVRIYYSGAEVEAGGVIKHSDTAASQVFADAPYAITPNTVLEFEFLTDIIAGSEGFAAVGWSGSASDTEIAPNLSRWFQIYGGLEQGGYRQDYRIEDQLNEYTTFRIHLGDILQAGQSVDLASLQFITDNTWWAADKRDTYFKDARLVEDVGLDGEHWSYDFATAEHSLSTIQIDYDHDSGSEETVYDDTYRSRLVIDGQVITQGDADEVLQVGDKAKVAIVHNQPSEFGIGTTVQPELPGFEVGDVARVYDRDPGQILTVGLEANQFSREHLIGLTENLNAALTDGGAGVEDIDELLAYTSAAYWFRFQESTKRIDSLLRVVGRQQWVGSGLVTADSELYDISGSGYEHLQFPILPIGMGVDLPNSNYSATAIDSSSGISDEAFQLVGWTASALENAILEELLNTESVSTIRGLKNAFENAPNTSVQTTTDGIMVFERVNDSSDAPLVYWRGNMGADLAMPLGETDDEGSSPAGDLQTRDGVRAYGPNKPIVGAISQSFIRSRLNHHKVDGEHVVADALWELLNDPDAEQVSVVIPYLQSRVGEWTGSVNIADIQYADGRRSSSYTIRAVDGLVTDGGYIGGAETLRLLPSALPPTTFVNQTFAGDPVAVANGNMFRDEVDFTFPNLQLPLDFTRHYDAQSDHDVGLGVGWVHSFTGVLYVGDQTQDPELGNNRHQKVVWLRPDGTRHTFEWVGSSGNSGYYKVPSSLRGHLVASRNTEGRVNDFKYYEKDGSLYQFEFAGLSYDDPEFGEHVVARLATISSRHGNTVDLDYEAGASVRVTAARDTTTQQRRVNFEYYDYDSTAPLDDYNSKVHAIKVDRGLEVDRVHFHIAVGYAWETDSGRRLAHAYPVVDGTESVSGYQTSYQYYLPEDFGGRTDDPRLGMMKAIIEPGRGETHTYEYYSNRRAFRVSAVTDQGPDGTLGTADDVSEDEVFTYDLFRNTTEFTDDNGHTETYHHRDDGLLTKQVHEDGSFVRFEWGAEDDPDFQGLMLASIDEVGAAEVFEYYTPLENSSGFRRYGELKNSVAPNGVGTHYDYFVSTFNGWQHVSEIADTYVYESDDVTVDTSINGSGRITFTGGATSLHTHYTRDGRGDITMVTDPLGNKRKVSRHNYDPAVTPRHLMGLPKHEIAPEGNARTSTGPTIDETVVWQPIFDEIVLPAGRVTVRLKADGSATGGDDVYVVADAVRLDRIDTDGVVTRIVDDGDDAFATSITAGELRPVSGDHTQYGGDSTLFQWVVGHDNYATWTFDNLEAGTYRVSSLWVPFDGATARDKTARYEVRTSNGSTQNLAGFASVNQQLAPVGFNSYQTDYEYDTAGSVVSAITEGLPSGRTFYDHSGNPLFSRDATGVGTRYEYDVRGRLNKTYTVASGDYIDFSTAALLDYLGQSGTGSASSAPPEVSEGGRTLRLTEDTWRYLGIDPLVISDTLVPSATDGPTFLEFDFRSTLDEGEAHAIRLSNGSGYQHSIKLWGNTPGVWGTDLGYDSNDGWRHFRVNLTELQAAWSLTGEDRFQTGPYTQLVFANDDDGDDGVSGEGDSWFSNVRVYQERTSTAVVNIKPNATNVLSYHGGGSVSQDQTPSSYETPNGNTLHLWDNTWKAIQISAGTSYEVTPNTVISFDFKAYSVGESHALRLVNSLNSTASVAGFSLLGTHQPAPDQYTIGQGWVRFEYRVGEYYTGPAKYLALINDDDGEGGTAANDGDSWYRNIQVFEDRVETDDVNMQITNYYNGLRPSETLDGTWRKTRFHYDERGRQIRTIGNDRTYSSVEYDGVGNVVASTDLLGATTRFVYDSRNRLIQTLFADGSTTSSRYDGAGRMIASADQLGSETLFEYDSAGRLVETLGVVEFDGDAPEVYRSINRYDSYGRLQDRVDAAGVLTRTFYNDNSQPSTEVVYEDETATTAVSATFIGYNRNGQLESTTAWDLSGNAQPQNNTLTSRRYYDSKGQQVAIENPDGTTIRTTYDAAGRVVGSYDELDRKVTSVYDVYGRLERTVLPDPDGAHGPRGSQYTRYVLDNAGRVTQEWTNGNPIPTGEESAVWYRFDAIGQPLRRTDQYSDRFTDFAYDAAGRAVSSTDALGSSTLSTYDAMGRVAEVRLADPDGDGPLTAPATRSRYDAAGRLLSAIDAAGVETWFRYDSLGRLREESRFDTRTIDNSENPASGFTSSKPASSSGQSWTNYGRDVQAWNTPVTAAWDFGEMAAGKHRIAISRLSVEDYGEGASIRVLKNGVLDQTLEVTDARNAPVFTEAYGDGWYDWTVINDSLTLAEGDTLRIELVGGGSDPSQWVLADAVRADRVVTKKYGYDSAGNLATETDVLGRTASYEHDEFGRVTKSTLPDPDGPGGLTAPSTTTIYDSYGNVVETIEHRGGGNNERRTLSVYDQRGRVIEQRIVGAATDGSDLVSLSEYDFVGNLVRSTDPTGVVTTTSYDALSLPVSEIRGVGVIAASDSPAARDPIVIDPLTLEDYSSNPQNGFGEQATTVSANGLSLTLKGQSWQAVPINYVVRHNTVLEFDFHAQEGAEYYLVGFDNDNTLDLSGNSDTRSEAHFELGGLSSYGLFSREYRQEDLGGGLRRVYIPLGELIDYSTQFDTNGDGQVNASDQLDAIPIERLVFGVLDYRNAAEVPASERGSATFANIRLYESDHVHTHWDYDTRGNLSTVEVLSDPRSVVTSYTYDRHSNRTREIIDDGGVGKTPFSRTSTRTWTYDQVGNVKTESQSFGGGIVWTSTSHQYDRLHREILTIGADPATGAAASADWVPEDNQGLAPELQRPFTTFSYDTRGAVVATRDAAGQSSHSAYDGAGRLVSALDGNHDETLYRYDSAGNLRTTIDAAGNATSYAYDDLNRVTAETNELGDARQTVYNDQGNVRYVIDREGRYRFFVYDSLDRLTLEKWDDNGSTTNPRTAFEWRYDDAGRVVYQRNDGAIDTFVYDDLGRIATRRNYDPSVALPDHVPVRHEYEYSYEAVLYTTPNEFMNQVFYRDRVATTEVTASNSGDTALGKKTTDYDRQGRLWIERDRDADAAAGPVVGAKDLYYSYLGDGSLRSIGRYGDWEIGGTWRTYLETDYDYDGIGRVESIDHNPDSYRPDAASIGTMRRYEYDYDAASRITSFASYDRDGQTFAKTQAYDLDGQLFYNDGEFIEYDDNGNRLSYDGLTVVNDRANRVVSDGTYFYEYDKVGNRTRRTEIATGKVKAYTWDHHNRLMSVEEFTESNNRVIDFSAQPLADFSGQSNGGTNVDPGTSEVLDDGQTLRLDGNYWRAIQNAGIAVGPDTVIEFDFKSTRGPGEGHGLLISQSNSTIVSAYATVWGTHQRANNDNSLVNEPNGELGYELGDGWRHYRVSLGDAIARGIISAGTFNYLTFFIDDDGQNNSGNNNTPSEGDAWFSNVRIYDRASGTADSTFAYEYDANDRVVLTEKTTGAPFEVLPPGKRNVYEGDRLAMTFDESSGFLGSTLSRRYLSGPAVDMVLAEDVFDSTRGDASYWLLGDHQNTVRDTVDLSGSLRKTTDYDAFGNIADQAFYRRDETLISDAVSINFNEHPLIDYDPVAQDGANGRPAEIDVQLDGQQIVMQGNAWQAVQVDYTFTENTVVEFDFFTVGQGEIHGFKLDNDLVHSNSAGESFKLLGTDTPTSSFSSPPGYPSGYDTDGQWKLFQVPVGQIVSGERKYLVFINDNDSNDPMGFSVFKNVRIYESDNDSSGVPSPGWHYPAEENPQAIGQSVWYAGRPWDEAAEAYDFRARWYDPATGKFLSEDPSGFGGGDANLYRYVGNSPLNFSDPSGLRQAGNPLDSLSLTSRPTGVLDSIFSTTPSINQINAGPLFGGVDSFFAPSYSQPRSPGQSASLRNNLNNSVDASLDLIRQNPIQTGSYLGDFAVHLATEVGALAERSRVGAVTHYRQDTQNDRVNAILRRNDVINNGSNFGTVRGLGQQLAMGTTDEIAFAGIAAYDPIANRPIVGQERFTRTLAGVSNTALNVLAPAHARQTLSAVGRNSAANANRRLLAGVTIQSEQAAIGSGVVTASGPGATSVAYAGAGLTSEGFVTTATRLAPLSRDVAYTSTFFTRSSTVSRGANLNNLSVSAPRTAVTRSVGGLREAGLKDAHHVIQEAAVRDLPGYRTNAAPGVQLLGPSTARGTPHYIATQVQRQSGGGTYGAERRIGYKGLRKAGFSPADARQAIEEADVYFSGLGVRPDTPTRIPGNR